MVFNSLTYLTLLFSVVVLFWSIKNITRFYLIFLASLIFYGFWKVEFIALLLFSTFIDWFLALKIHKSKPIYKKKLLILSIVINLVLLFIFKYLIFFTANTFILLNFFGAGLDPIILKIVLPLGISFYTFQTISYTVDVYRKVIKPEKKFIIYACYVTFFPQLIAGPILRAKEVISQFKQKNKFNYNFIFDGFRRILYGLFLKVVLADNIAPLINSGFSLDAHTISALDVWTLAFLFGFQIYFDFSGYSHIAIGSAKMIGINFPENFNFPYMANSPKDFWRKWHISLSSWVRDYLYLPLQGEKFQSSSSGGLEKATTNKNDHKPLFITWALMGFWHGANWTFIIWGLYHALIIFAYRKISLFTSKMNIFLKHEIGIFFTLPLIMLSWVPFRSENIKDTFVMWSKIFNPFNYFSFNLHENTYIVTFLILNGLALVYIFKKYFFVKKIVLIIDVLIICVLFFLTFIFLRPINQFIYFQF